MKPIIFSTPMVQAILDGRKFQTRRVVKFSKGSSPTWSGYMPDGSVLYGSNNVPAAKAAYKPGDVLWVRETWQRNSLWESEDEQSYSMCIVYKADGHDETIPLTEEEFEHHMSAMSGTEPDWHPSIHMPRSAARLFLRVVSVRAERVQDITGNQCAAEGIALYSGPVGKREDYYRGEFSKLWDSINAKRSFSWNSNPWVWVISFEKTEKPEVEG